MKHIPDLAEARSILCQYNQQDFHIKHAETVAKVMGYFARQHAAEQVEYWQVVGLLHDIDFEMYPEAHCVKGEELLTAAEVEPSMIRAALSHGYGMTETPYQPEHIMEKILFAVDELTGLIGAVVLMRPSKSLDDLETKSVLKKFKDKGFAAGCSRDVIRQGAERLGWSLEELISQTIEAMRAA